MLDGIIVPHLSTAAHSDVKVYRHADGRRDVVVRDERGTYWVLVRAGDRENYLRGFSMRRRAMWFARSAAADRYL
jgi:hypothetical protein